MILTLRAFTDRSLATGSFVSSTRFRIVAVLSISAWFSFWSIGVLVLFMSASHWLTAVLSGRAPAGGAVGLAGVTTGPDLLVSILSQPAKTSDSAANSVKARMTDSLSHE